MQQKQLLSVMKVLRGIYNAAQINASRSRKDIFADRICKTMSKPVITAVNDLMSAMQCDSTYLSDAFARELAVVATISGHVISDNLAKHSKVIAMICAIKDEQQFCAAVDDLIQCLTLDAEEYSDVFQLPRYDINIKLHTLSPFAHGADNKAGNATLFRRTTLLGTQGHPITLPYFAGNALRGQMRDVLADHFLSSIGIQPDKSHPPVALWFFHALYAGGVLEENSSATKQIAKLLGDSGSIRAGGIRALRNYLPALSLLGAAFGNRIISGRVSVGNFYPLCKETGHGDRPAESLLDWHYLTRREDNESHEEHHGMIADTQVLQPGVTLAGGVDISGHITHLERSALAVGLQLLQQHGYLGAESRRGFGRVEMEIDGIEADAGEMYNDYLATHRQEILDFLTSLRCFVRESTDASKAAKYIEQVLDNVSD